jgi:hypothetical protein
VTRSPTSSAALETQARVEEMLRESIPSDPDLPSYPNRDEVEERLGELERRRNERAQRRLNLKAHRSPSKSAGRTFRAIAAISAAAAAAAVSSDADADVDDSDEDADFGGDTTSGTRTRSSSSGDSSALGGAQMLGAGGHAQEDEDVDLPDVDIDAPIVLGRSRASASAVTAPLHVSTAVSAACASPPGSRASSKRKRTASAAAFVSDETQASTRRSARLAPGIRGSAPQLAAAKSKSLDESLADFTEDEFDFSTSDDESDKSDLHAHADGSSYTEVGSGNSVGIEGTSSEGESAVAPDRSSDSGRRIRTVKSRNRPISTEIAMSPSPRLRSRLPVAFHACGTAIQSVRSHRQSLSTSASDLRGSAGSGRSKPRQLTAVAASLTGAVCLTRSGRAQRHRKALVALQDVQSEKRATRSSGAADLYMLA